MMIFCLITFQTSLENHNIVIIIINPYNYMLSFSRKNYVAKEKFFKETFSAVIKFNKMQMLHFHLLTEANMATYTKKNFKGNIFYYLPSTVFSCLELAKKGLNDGFGVEPMEMLSISKPDSSPSPHDNDSSS